MKNNKAITLIALVITIIILIILAGVAINLTMKDGGIIEKALRAKENTQIAQEEEKNTLNELYSSLMIATNDGAEVTISVKDLKTLISEEVKSQLGTSSSVPAGTVISYIAGTVAPEGYLKCDGTVYNISEYQTLADAIKTGLGSYNYYGGDGTTTFAVPDLRGEFLRGTGTNSYTNQGSGTTVGKHQDATNFRYEYSDENYINWRQIRTDTNTTYYDSYIPNSGKVSFIKGSVGGWNSNFAWYTSRPTNTSVLYCIKY